MTLMRLKLFVKSKQHKIRAKPFPSPTTSNCITVLTNRKMKSTKREYSQADNWHYTFPQQNKRQKTDKSYVKTRARRDKTTTVGLAALSFELEIPSSWWGDIVDVRRRAGWPRYSAQREMSLLGSFLLFAFLSLRERVSFLISSCDLEGRCSM